jgi:transposase
MLKFKISKRYLKANNRIQSALFVFSICLSIRQNSIKPQNPAVNSTQNSSCPGKIMISREKWAGRYKIS